MSVLLRALLLITALSLVGCPKQDHNLVLVGGQPVDAATIDAQPLRLLPSGALIVGDLDAQALFRTNLGTQVAQIIANVLPLGPESNFSPSRDVTRVYSAIYAMQGADFVSVLQGRFDVATIERAAQARTQTPSGQPLTLARYAEYTIYKVGGVGFVLLTPTTILSGNETGIRRALDRLRHGKLDDALAPWMRELLGSQNSAFTMVGDVRGQGVVSALDQQLPFMKDLQLVRVLGNFESPGVNVVGSLTYTDEAAATLGAKGLSQLQDLAYLGSLLASWGMGGQRPELDVSQQGADVAFATSVDATTVAVLLGLLVTMTQSGPSAWGWLGG
jgi:hypothetical protein